MRIAFYDTAGLSYHATSVDSIALGGAESAACYLTRSLAGTGHEVFLVTKTSEPGTYDGVRCVPHGLREQLPWGRLDAVIWMGPPVGISEIRLIAPRARLIFWSPHMPSQPVVQFLARPDGWGLFDAIMMVSRWQAEQFGQKFGVPPQRMFVLRNAIGFAFERQFAPGESILPAKVRPPVLAYTSTPFRGLDVLLDAFPFIRAAVPGVRLKVFSSMRVYQTPAAEEAAQFGRLYARCAQTPGVEHVGSLPQPQLAAALREVSV